MPLPSARASALPGLTLSILALIGLSACGQAAAPAPDDTPALTANEAFVVVPPGGRDVTLGGAVLEAGASDVSVTGVSTPIAGRVELHTMSMQDGRMQMRPLDALDIPAGERRTLARGGDHLMLFDIAPLEPGNLVPLTLTYRTADGREATLDVEAEIRPLGDPATE